MTATALESAMMKTTINNSMSVNPLVGCAFELVGYELVGSELAGSLGLRSAADDPSFCGGCRSGLIKGIDLAVCGASPVTAKIQYLSSFPLPPLVHLRQATSRQLPP